MMRRIALTLAALASGIVLTAAVRHLTAEASARRGTATRPSAEVAPIVGQWRIETVVELGGQPLPSQSLSIAHEGKVYNVVEDTAAGAVVELAVLDPAAQRFQLFRPAGNLACEVTFDEITQWLEAARDRVREQVAGPSTDVPKQRQALIRFLLDPAFETTVDAKSGTLQLTSQYVTYQVRGSTLTEASLRLRRPILLAKRETSGDTPEVVMRSLQTYWDWHARLNRLLNPNALPPEVRMALNAQLVKHRLVPEEVALQLSFDGSPRVRTLHEVTWQHARGDVERIKRLEKQLGAARRLPFADYVANVK